MTNPGTTTNHSHIRPHSVLIVGAGPVGHQVHVAGGGRSRPGGDGLTGLVGVGDGGGVDGGGHVARNIGGNSR